MIFLQELKEREEKRKDFSVASLLRDDKVMSERKISHLDKSGIRNDK